MKKVVLIFLCIVLAYSVSAATYYCDSCSNCSSTIQVVSGGDIVVLNQSISASGNCIQFNGKDNVTFDCGMNSIVGDNSGGAIYLSNAGGGSNNNTIKNCPNINSFYYGVVMIYCQDNVFRNISIYKDNQKAGLVTYYSSYSNLGNDIDTSNTINGKPIYYYDGVHSPCPNNQIIEFGNNVSFVGLFGCNNVTIQNTNLTDMLELYYTNSSTISNVSILNSNMGIYHKYGYYNSFYDITTNNNFYGFWGDYIYWSNYSNITSNNNGNTGMLLQFGSYNQIKNLVSMNNSEDGLSLWADSNDEVINSALVSNSGYGLKIGHDADNNTIINSTIKENSPAGLFFDKSDANLPEYNLIYNNFLNNSVNVQIDKGITGDNYFNTTLDCTSTNIIGGNCIGGNYYATPSGTGFSETCIDSTGDGICDSTYNLSNSDSYAYDYYALTEVTPGIPCYNCSNCSAQIQAASAGEIIRLNNSIYGATGSYCIDFNGKDEIIFDCDSKTIHSETCQNGIYFNSAGGGSNNNEVKNCPNISSFTSTGVSSFSSSNNHLENLSVYDAVGSGLMFYNSANFSLQNVNINKQSQVHGIWITAYSNDVSYFVHDIDNTNTVNDIPVNYFDGTYRACPNDSVIDYGNNASYIGLVGCSNVTLRNINPTDALLLAYTNNSFIENIAISNSGREPFKIHYSYYNNFRDIVLRNNGQFSIYLYYGANSNFTNIVTSGHTYGFYLSYFSNYNIIENLTSLENTRGLNIVSDSHNNIIRNSHIVNNTEYGAYTLTANGNVITNTTICYNTNGNYFKTATNYIENNTFCVDDLAPLSSWYNSVSEFRFNVSNTFFTTNCILYVDGSESGNATSITQHISTNVSYSATGSGSHNWNVWCNDSYGNYANSSLFYFNIKKSTTESCTYDYECLGGYCVHGICRSKSYYCGDNYCDDGETCSSCEDDCGRRRSSSRPSSEPTNHIDTTFHQLTPGETRSFKITDKEYCVDEIKVKAKEDTSSFKITVTKITQKPSSIPELSKESCCFVKIDAANIDYDEVESITVRFPIEKKWLVDNKLDKATVKLNRYSTQWEELETNYLSEDDSYFYFESVTPGFSIFAVTADEVEEEIPALDTTTSTILSTVQTTMQEVTSTTIQDIKDKSKNSAFGFIMMLIALLILTVIYFKYYKEKKRR
ncbi:PGF-pre-PGF domain-containing protein [Candidatus Woesearchaeota archaeon]|nr:PGF-pre-PGF domain-containing protein [Candidatus Woesearchaeota archaeon]